MDPIETIDVVMMHDGMWVIAACIIGHTELQPNEVAIVDIRLAGLDEIPNMDYAAMECAV